MKKFNLKKVSNSIQQTCFDVDRYITGQPEADAEFWSKANSIRHAYTILEIVRYAKKKDKNFLKILNASGLSCGHQDFSIATFLREQTAIRFKWIAYESPHSEYLSNDRFKSYISDLQINLRLSDWNQSPGLYGEDSDFDVVIFTEIVEHLDHSTLLKCLMAIRERMRDDGILVITTPNSVSLINRIKILLANGDDLYWGDGRQNYERGLYGHIAAFDLRRMERLLEDTGYRSCEAFTFTYKPYTFACNRTSNAIGIIKFTVYRAIDFLSQFGNTMGRSLFIVAEKCDEAKEIPFQI
ncbi:MAG: methyltransferase domain-containing protein [bacterium]